MEYSGHKSRTESRQISKTLRPQLRVGEYVHRVEELASDTDDNVITVLPGCAHEADNFKWSGTS